jgi:ribonuclease D
VHTLRTAKHLAVARELWLARDRLGRERDIAPGRLVPDSALMAAARAMPTRKGELMAIKEFNGRASRSAVDVWWAAIEAGLAATDLPAMRVPSATLPPPRAWADRNPEADARLKAARAAVIDRAESLDIPVENLLTPETLRRVAWTALPEPSAEAVSALLTELGARPWQIEQTAQLIAQAFVDIPQEASEDSSTDSSE